jgi:hypothetical protein
MVPLPMWILLRYLNREPRRQLPVFFVARWASAIPSSGIRLLPFPAPSRVSDCPASSWRTVVFSARGGGVNRLSEATKKSAVAIVLIPLA